MSPSDPDSSASRRQALAENPAIADWFFHERIRYFIEEFYVGILGATDYWLRFEWQHCGSPHVHGLAWLPNVPDIQHTLESLDYNTTALEDVVSHIDGLITTMNPAILNDGSIKLHHHKLTPISATNHMLKCRITIKTMLT